MPASPTSATLMGIRLETSRHLALKGPNASSGTGDDPPPGQGLNQPWNVLPFRVTGVTAELHPVEGHGCTTVERRSDEGVCGSGWLCRGVVGEAEEG